MEAVKETKITLIHRLNVKPGVAIVVRNVPCLQIMLCALLLLYWPLMFKNLYICICICHHLSIPANSVKPESVFQIICLYTKSKISQLNQRNPLMKQKTVCYTYFASEGFSFCKYSLKPFV
jgi:hypothetical protein